MIQAGAVTDIRPESGEWLFVDVGFSSAGKTCGVLSGTNAPECVTFGELSKRVVAAGAQAGPPLNLLIEAPLSVAFNARGNPTGRTIERLGSTRSSR
jgi:hypothetical protein